MQVQTSQYQAPPNGFRTFVILWATQALSVFGSQLTFFAMTVWLTTTLFPAPEQRGQLAAALSAVSLAFVIPNILVAPFAGTLVDRADRKMIMFWTDIGSGVVSTVLALALLAGAVTMPLLLALLVAFAVLSVFHTAAFDASYAMIVPEKQLPRANGMMQTVFSLTGILSPAVAATLIALPALMRGIANPGPLATRIAALQSGSVLAVSIDAVSFFVAASVLPFLRIPSPRQAAHAAAGAKRRSVLGDVREGLAFIKARPGLLWLLLTFAVFNFCTAPMGVLQPMVVRYGLANDYLSRGMSYETALALLGSIGSIGGVIGGIAVTAWGGLRKRRIYGAVVPLIVAGIAQATFGLSNRVFVAAACTAVFASIFPISNSHSQTIWQMQTPREMQGRVFAMRRVVAQFTVPLGTAVAGLLGGWLGPNIAITACGLIAVACAVMQLFNRTLTSVEETAPQAFLQPLATELPAVAQ